MYYTFKSFFIRFYELRFLNLFHEYKIPIKCIKWEKMKFNFEVVVTLIRLVLDKIAVINIVYSIKLGVIRNRGDSIKGHPI